MAYGTEVRNNLSKWFLGYFNVYDKYNYLKSHLFSLQLQDKLLFQLTNYPETWTWDSGLIIDTMINHRFQTSAWDVIRGESLFLEFVSTARCNDPLRPLMIVNMPLSKKYMLPSDCLMFDSAYYYINKLVGNYPNTYVYNAFNLIPDKYFYANTHFGKEAQEIYAEWLKEKIIDIIKKPKKK